MMNYYAPKPAPRGFRFGPGYGEQQPGWGGHSPNPTITNPIRPEPQVSAQAWPAEVSTQPYQGGLARDWTRERLGHGAWPYGYDQGYPGVLPMERFGGGWGFAPGQQAWGGHGGGWTGFDRLRR